MVVVWFFCSRAWSAWRGNGHFYHRKGLATMEEVEALRKVLKEHLINNGAITTMTGGNYAKFYNGDNIFKIGFK